MCRFVISSRAAQTVDDFKQFHLHNGYCTVNVQQMEPSHFHLMLLNNVDLFDMQLPLGLTYFHGYNILFKKYLDLTTFNEAFLEVLTKQE